MSRSGRASFVLSGSVAAIALVALGTGCARQHGEGGVVSVGTAEIHHATIEGPHVPAGTQIALRLVTPVGTDASRTGDPFTAAVAEDIVLADGTVALPAGALVRGTVAGVHTGDPPRLELDFGTVRTAWGERALPARLEAAETLHVPGPSEDHAPTAHPPAQATFQAGLGDTVEPRFLDRQRASSDSEPRQLHVPSGATMYIVLTRPIPR
jgi:hypothetical protein